MLNSMYKASQSHSKFAGSNPGWSVEFVSQAIIFYLMLSLPTTQQTVTCLVSLPFLITQFKQKVMCNIKGGTTNCTMLTSVVIIICWTQIAQQCVIDRIWALSMILEM